MSGLLYDEQSPTFLRRACGKVAGGFRKDGYVLVSVNNTRKLGHRVVWELFHGPLRSDQNIDHKDGNPSNNQISNLRICNQQQNIANCKNRKNNTTGLKGVSFHKKSNKYRAYISVNGKQTHLGLFSSPQEAHNKYVEAAKIHFDNFSRGS